MTTGPRSQCSTCLHFRPFDADHEQAWCAAFPGGILDTVYDGVLDHRQPVDGDHGVRWTPLPGETFPPNALAT